nr:hypothetical protein [Actinoplanes atraurantiacus]
MTSTHNRPSANSNVTDRTQSAGYGTSRSNPSNNDGQPRATGNRNRHPLRVKVP